MRSAVRRRVEQFAEHHKQLSDYFFERAGVEPPKDEEVPADQSEPAEGEASRKSSRRVAVDETEAEKSMDNQVADMHLAASRQLVELAQTAPSSATAAASDREGLPAYLRRGSVPLTR